jgi:hypothetical protein
MHADPLAQTSALIKTQVVQGPGRRSAGCGIVVKRWARPAIGRDVGRSVDPDARRDEAKGGRVLRPQLLWGHADARDPRALLRQIGGNLVRQGIPLGDPSRALERDHLAAFGIAVEVQRHLRIGADVPQEPDRGRLRLPAGGSPL